MQFNKQKKNFTPFLFSLSFWSPQVLHSANNLMEEAMPDSINFSKCAKGGKNQIYRTFIYTFHLVQWLMGTAVGS